MIDGVVWFGDVLFDVCVWDMFGVFGFWLVWVVIVMVIEVLFVELIENGLVICLFKFWLGW